MSSEPSRGSVSDRCFDAIKLRFTVTPPERLMHEQQSPTGDITTTKRNLIEHTENHRRCSQLRSLDMLKHPQTEWLCYWGAINFDSRFLNVASANKKVWTSQPSMRTQCCVLLRMQTHRKLLISAHKAGLNAHWFSYDFNLLESLENFFPQQAQLHFSKSVTHASMYAESE